VPPHVKVRILDVNLLFKKDVENSGNVKEHGFRLSRLLRASVFPFDFDSIPMMLAEDGEALHVLVINNQEEAEKVLISAQRR
jgi:hypothetical protein